MKINIVPIGNSKGIRIPKSILKQCNIDSQVDIEVEKNKIIIKSCNDTLRKGWNEAFKKMHLCGDDKLLIPDNIDLEDENWVW